MTTAAPTPPPGYEELQASELGRTFGKVVGIRLIIAPIAAVAIIALGFFEPALWRRLLFVVGALSIVSVSALEVYRFRRRGLQPGQVALNIGLGVYGTLILSFGTGALESPLIVLAIPLAILAGVFVPARIRAIYIGSQVLAVWFFALLEVRGWIPDLNLSAFGGGSRAGHSDAHLWTSALVLTLALGLAAGLGKGLRFAFDTMLRRALEAREESLRAHAERSRELVALSGEIAHELKNPLASAKGLSALLAREAAEGKPAERIAVLRKEIDRMQGILDEFLNFSRPLVPLALERADLAELCAEIAALHEGMASDRDIALNLRGARCHVRCDPRKVKQVVINLVQNAIHASPDGATVEIEVEGGGEVSRLRVLDRGPGIDPAISERLFEPGVTTKARGSGLGLTIARALARQHGGELTLAHRDGGGCIAELSLPIAPTAEAGLEGAGASKGVSA